MWTGAEPDTSEVSSSFLLFCGAVKARTGYLQAGTKKTKICIETLAEFYIMRKTERQLHEVYKRYQNCCPIYRINNRYFDVSCYGKYLWVDKLNVNFKNLTCVNNSYISCASVFSFDVLKKNCQTNVWQLVTTHLSWMVQKTFMWCLITFYVSTNKSFHEHLRQGTRDFSPTMEVFILEKEQGEVWFNL